MPKRNISPSTSLFPHKKERYEIFDGKIFARNLVEKIKIFVQDFVPIRTALRFSIKGRFCFIGLWYILYRGQNVMQYYKYAYNFPPDWGMLRRPRRVPIFLQTVVRIYDNC